LCSSEIDSLTVGSQTVLHTKNVCAIYLHIKLDILNLITHYFIAVELKDKEFFSWPPLFYIPQHIQGDQKSLCTWWLLYRKLQVMFKVSAASLKTFFDTRLALTPSVIHTSNYVIMISEWNRLKYFCLFLYCNHQVHRDLLITLYLSSSWIFPRHRHFKVVVVALRSYKFAHPPCCYNFVRNYGSTELKCVVLKIGVAVQQLKWGSDANLFTHPHIVVI
jgi:hypothetical protein